MATRTNSVSKVDVLQKNKLNVVENPTQVVLNCMSKMKGVTARLGSPAAATGCVALPLVAMLPKFQTKIQHKATPLLCTCVRANGTLEPSARAHTKHSRPAADIPLLHTTPHNPKISFYMRLWNETEAFPPLVGSTSCACAGALLPCCPDGSAED